MIPIEENIAEVENKKIMKEILKLIPNQGKGKIDALKEIVWYLGAILLGDDIHQFATYSYHTEYAKSALDVLVKYVQEHSIEDYKKLVEELKKEITGLEDKKTNLSTDISSLEKQKAELEEELSSIKKKIKLATDVSSLERQKEELEEQVSNLENEISKLNRDIKDLEISKSISAEENKETQKSLINYQKAIMSYDNDLSTIWEQVDEDHPIYELNSLMLKSYINCLKRNICRKLFISKEECEDLFVLHNNAGLEKLYECMYDVANRHGNPDVTLREILSNSEKLYRGISPYNYERIPKQISYVKEALEKVRIPRIVSKMNIPVYDIDDTMIIDNNKMSQSTIRELCLQRRLLESIAKQRIAEAQLNMIIRELGKNPANLELINSINNYFINDDLPNIMVYEKSITR